MTITSNQDGFGVNNHGDTFAFRLQGGRYGVVVAADFSGGGSITYQIGPLANGNYVAVRTAYTANGSASLDLPAGSYRLLVDFANAATTTTNANTALTHANTVDTDIRAIVGVGDASIALGVALVAAVQAIVDAVAAKLPATARAAVVTAQAASAACAADATIAADATTMTALGVLDGDLSTLATNTAAAPTAIAASLGSTPMRRSN